jgi:inosine-uridine nucleoside N-ribohydrolase
MKLRFAPVSRLAACCLGLALSPLLAAPVPVIFDTDITGDCDDVLALAMLHTLADRGHCEILGVTISKENPLAAPFVDAVNTFYGRPDIPIGVGEKLQPRDSKYLGIVETRDGGTLRYPHDLGSGQQVEKAVPLLKRLLEEAEDGSVAVIQVGLATNLAQLIETEVGKSLVGQKVDHLSVMAGAFETINSNNRYLEANVINDIPSMQILADQWPAKVPVIWSGFEIGIAAPYPRQSIKSDFGYVAHHPVKEAYLAHSGPEHDRPTWDLTSVLYSVFPDRGYFGLSPQGRVSVAGDGATFFKPARKNQWQGPTPKDAPAETVRDRYLTMDAAQAAKVQEALVQLVVQPPAQLADEGDAPVKLIFDTDMGNDIDDAMALAMIFALERRGACDLLAITSTKDHPKSAAYVDAFCTFYGRPEVPIGAVRHGANPDNQRPYLPQADNYPHDLKSGVDAPDALDLLRKTLAAQSDGSVTLAQVGFFTNFARLLDTEADVHSPLNGVELIRKKVKELVVMAGAFQTIRFNNRYREYNVFKDIPPARKLAEKWPTPILWSGFEIGINATYPWQSIVEDFENPSPHILKDSYLDYVPEQPHDRPTWDLTAVLQAVYPNRGYFDLSPKGKVTITPDGMSFYQPPPRFQPAEKHTGRDRYLIMDAVQAERVREALVQLTSEPAPR